MVAEPGLPTRISENCSMSDQPSQPFVSWPPATAMTAAGSDALPPASPGGPSLTPTTRPSTGMSPPAKRTSIRLEADDPGPGQYQTIQDLSRAVSRIVAQQALDTAWAKTVQEAITDHAERIDACVYEIKASKRGIKQVEEGMGDMISTTNLNLKGMADNLRDNDVALKKAVEENDVAFKKVVEVNDMALKKAIEGNDAALKTALAANDVYVKAALESVSGRIECLVKAMAEEVDSVVKTVRTQPSRDEMGRAIHGAVTGALTAFPGGDPWMGKTSPASPPGVETGPSAGPSVFQMTPGAPWSGYQPQTPHRRESGGDGGGGRGPGDGRDPGRGGGQGAPTRPPAPSSYSDGHHHPGGPGGHAITLYTKLFDEKVAKDKDLQYDGNDNTGPRWITKTRKYFIGRAPDVKPMLKWAEARGDEPISEDDIKAAGLVMGEADPMILNHHVWAYLNLNLIGNAELIFNNVKDENGLEVWRKLSLSINSKTEARRMVLKNKVQNPSQVNKMEDVPMAIETWEKAHNEYVAAGGGEINEEDMRNSMLKIIPVDLREHIFWKLGEFPTCQKMKEFLRRQIELLGYWRKNFRALHMMDGEPRSQGIDIAGMINNLSSLSPGASPEEMLAVMHKYAGGNFKPGQRSGGQREASKAPPRSAQDFSCVNCGQTGRSAQRCPRPRVDKHDRPCFKCGQKGHFATNCTAGTAAKVVEQTEEPTGPNHWGLCLDVIQGNKGGTCPRECHGEWEKPKRTCKPQQQQVTLGGFLSPNRWEKFGESNKETSAHKSVKPSEKSMDVTDEDTQWEILKSAIEGYEKPEARRTRMATTTNDPPMERPDRKKHITASGQEMYYYEKPTKPQFCHMCGEVSIPKTTQKCPLCNSINCLSDNDELKDEMIELGLMPERADPRPQGNPVQKTAGDENSGRTLSSRRPAHPADGLSGSTLEEAAARGTLSFGDAINFFEVVDGELHGAEEDFPDYIEFEVALDSGAGAHVADRSDAPAYSVEESEGSRTGAGFLSASNQKIRNEGQFTLNLEDDVGSTFTSTFQVAKVSRPLWSVSYIADQGYETTFNEVCAIIRDKKGRQVARIPRRGGLYVGKMKLRNPRKAGFGRQGSRR